MTSIVTKTGDKGTTGLFGTKRVPKNHPRIHAYGTVDELNAHIGVIVCEQALPIVLRAQLQELQHMLYVLCSDLATPMDSTAKTHRITAGHIAHIEEWVKILEEELPPLQHFIVPGGTRSNALLHVARTVCRRAERETVTLKDVEPINEDGLIFLNRLSDYLFLAARKSAIAFGKPESKAIVA